MRTAIAALLFVLCLTLPVRADSVTGSLSVYRENGNLLYSGNFLGTDENGQNFLIGLDGGGNDPFAPCTNSGVNVCAPGQALRSAFNVTEGDGSAFVTIDGITGGDSEGVNRADGIFSFVPDWAVALPPGSPRPVSFLLSGTINVFGWISGPEDEGLGEVGFSAPVIARFSFIVNETDSRFYALDRIDFEVSAAPVPEPATLLLFGGGVTGLLVRLRRRAK